MSFEIFLPHLEKAFQIKVSLKKMTVVFPIIFFVCDCKCSFLSKSFIEIQVTHHTITSSEGYDSAVFSIFTELSNRHHSVS